MRREHRLFFAVVAMSCALLALLQAAPASAAPRAQEQQKRPRLEAGLAGMVGFGFWGNRAALTFGGPRLVVAYGDFAAGLSFFPSIVYGAHTDQEVRPMLGFGPELTVKRIVFFTPYYYLGDRIRPLVGIGWKF